jgi:hypothetical protein
MKGTEKKVCSCGNCLGNLLRIILAVRGRACAAPPSAGTVDPGAPVCSYCMKTGRISEMVRIRLSQESLEITYLGHIPADARISQTHSIDDICNAKKRFAHNQLPAVSRPS